MRLLIIVIIFAHFSSQGHSRCYIEAGAALIHNCLISGNTLAGLRHVFLSFLFENLIFIRKCLVLLGAVE